MKQRRVIRRALVAGAALVMLVGSSVPPSEAVANLAVGALFGGGTISPGLNVVPAAQTWTFSGSALMAGVMQKSPGTGSSSCTASGSSTIAETFTYGAGTGTWSCSTGPLAGKGGGLLYVRAGALVLVVLTAPAVQGGALVCVFTPGSLNLPVTSYSLSCVAAIGGVK